MNKTCKICNKKLELVNFRKQKGYKAGYANICKECNNLRSKEYYKKNTERYRKYGTKYYKNNSEKLNNDIKRKEYIKNYRIKNKQELFEKNKVYSNKNKSKIKEYQRNYYLDNKDKIQKYGNDYIKDKYKTNLFFKINSIISKSINRGIKNIKEGKSWKDILPYTVNELMNHLESKFEKDMSWENYGKDGWHIDHVIPISLFKYNSYNHPAFKACWSLKNLQPMWCDENYSKGNRITITEEIKELLDRVNA